MLIHKAQPSKDPNFDIIEKNGEILEVWQQEYGQEILSNIADVRLDGEELIVSDKVIIYYTKKYFVIKTIPIDKDVANRLAPIITYGEFPNIQDPEWSLTVSTDVERFTNRIGRSLEQSVTKSINQGLSHAWQRSRTQNDLLYPVLSGILVLVIVGIGYFLIKEIYSSIFTIKDIFLPLLTIGLFIVITYISPFQKILISPQAKLKRLLLGFHNKQKTKM